MRSEAIKGVQVSFSKSFVICDFLRACEWSREHDGRRKHSDPPAPFRAQSVAQPARALRGPGKKPLFLSFFDFFHTFLMFFCKMSWDT